MDATGNQVEGTQVDLPKDVVTEVAAELEGSQFVVDTEEAAPAANTIEVNLAVLQSELEKFNNLYKNNPAAARALLDTMGDREAFIKAMLNFEMILAGETQEQIEINMGVAQDVIEQDGEESADESSEENLEEKSEELENSETFTPANQDAPLVVAPQDETSDTQKDVVLPAADAPKDESKKVVVPDVDAPKDETEEVVVPDVDAPKDENKEVVVLDVDVPKDETKEVVVLDVDAPKDETKEVVVLDVDAPKDETSDTTKEVDTSLGLPSGSPILTAFNNAVEEVGQALNVIKETEVEAEQEQVEESQETQSSPKMTA